VQSNNVGAFTVTFTVTDSSGLPDPTRPTRLVDVCAPPSVRLLAPTDLYLQSSTDLTVSAQPCFESTSHAGWGIRFAIAISGGEIVSQFDDYSAPYSGTFAGLERAEYTVFAKVIDGSGNEVTGPQTSVQANPVGIGDYYVAFGDSITLGIGDDIASDDTSDDGRNIRGGYEPILNDLLTATKAYPHTFVNKGTAGDTSVEGLSLLPSVLNEHPEAQFFLIQFGTNDAGIPLPSGLGLTAGQTGYADSFKDNIQQMITLIRSAGKEAYLAKAPYAKGNYSDRNSLIQQYNQVIDELVLENSILVSAPDLYNFFQANQNQYSDNIHPDGTGYQSIADLWYAVLSP